MCHTGTACEDIETNAIVEMEYTPDGQPSKAKLICPSGLGFYNGAPELTARCVNSKWIPDNLMCGEYK